ncbi:hypothetical protein J2Z60_001441 [Lactobacillus colini]|uniref:Uncharacterized protein n=1 Tax=Lactobacillus colini TaxID=1819254 RepID=A0ABS4MFX4_9LACO|nr:hypothetical protein [Lactobacillus colini]
MPVASLMNGIIVLKVYLTTNLCKYEENIYGKYL